MWHKKINGWWDTLEFVKGQKKYALKRRYVRASPKDSSNKILLLIWKVTLIFKISKDTSIKILQIKIDSLSSNLES